MRLEPRLRNYGSTSLYMKRLDYEPTLRFLADRVRPGDAVLDVGANYGVYSLVLAARIAPSGRVIAFEPGREAFVQLRRNLDRNRGLSVDAIALGLSDTVESRSLYHIGGAPTYSLSGFGGEITEVVNVTTLDAWWPAAGLDHLDVMKVDVEGHEPHVFRGGLATLGATRPLILFEVSAEALRRGGGTVDDPYTVLRALGYAFFVLSGQGLQQVEHSAVGNIVAVHPQSLWPKRLDGVGDRP
jgi:FkbM family methyltransferase